MEVEVNGFVSESYRQTLARTLSKVQVIILWVKNNLFEMEQISETLKKENL